MSRLVQSLERLYKGASAAPLGFGFQRAAQKEKPAVMVLISASAKADALLQAAALSEGVLLQPTGHSPSAAALKKVSEGAKDAMWGVRSDQLKAEQVKSLKEQGCDFVVLTSTDVPLEVLQGEDLAKVLVLPQGLKEEQARTIESAPIDVVMASQPLSTPLTLQTLLDVAEVRWLVNKPFLQPVLDAPSRWELECLRDIGVDGLVLLSDSASAESLQSLHDRLREVPAKRPKSDRAVALLPQASSPGGPRRAMPEPEPDEGDDD